MSEQASEAAPEAAPEAPEAPAAPVEAVAEAPAPPSSDWRAQLPEYAREWSEVKSAKTMDDFVSWVDNARSLVGSSVRVPGKDAGAEDIAAFNKKLLESNAEVMMRPRDDAEATAAFNSLGRPAESAGYDMESVEGFSPDPDRMASLKQLAHDANLTTKQFSKFMEGAASLEAAAGQAISESREASTVELRQEWGAAYDQRVGQVKDFLHRMNAPQVFQEAEQAGELNGEFYKFLHGCAERIGGEGQPGATNTGERYALTPADAKAKMAEIRANPASPFNNGDRDAIDAMVKLQRQATGGDPITTFSSG